jgi:hypothetical protein
MSMAVASLNLIWLGYSEDGQGTERGTVLIKINMRVNTPRI